MLLQLKTELLNYFSNVSCYACFINALFTDLTDVPVTTKEQEMIKLVRQLN